VCVAMLPSSLMRALQRSRSIAATAMACVVLCAGASAALSENCKPSRPKPLVVLRTMKPCAFDPQRLEYRGEPIEQAMCLMRGMDASRNLAPMLDSLPWALATRVGKNTGLPSRELLSAFLSSQDLEWDFAAYLWQPVSHAKDNDPDTPAARYFVIHDTSAPNYGRRAFPGDIDSTSRINSLKTYRCLARAKCY
jgi:hypothetical protein